MTKCFVQCVLFCFLAATARAQSSEDSIRSVILDLFVAMKNSDTVALKSCFSETAFLQTFSRPKDGTPRVETETVSGFCKAVASMPKGAADERVVFKDIKVDGNMASVWAPFKLYFNGAFYSCGVNSIQMARIQGVWKIQYLLDTRRKDNCVE